MAAVDPLDAVRVVLQGPLGLTQQCATRFVNTAGITSLDDFVILQPDDAKETCKRHNEAHSTGQLRQFALGITHQKKLEGFLYWYHDKRRRQQPIIAAEFTLNVMVESMEKYRAQTVEEETEQKELNPGQIETGSGWFGWSERAESALLGMKGCSGQGPLYRVIREDRPVGWIPPNDTMRLCYDLPLQGISFDQDNRQVWRLLQRWIIKDPIYNWLKEYESSEDGRGAWLALKSQLEGTAAINARANEARRILGTGQGSASWTSEYGGMSFESYSTKLQHAYTSDEKCYGTVTHPHAKVQRLLDGMKPSDKQTLIAIAKSHVQDNLMNDWIGACQYLKAKVDEAFPPRQTHGRKRGYRQVSQTGSSGRGGRFGQGGGGQRGRGKARKGDNVFNGVDISNPNRKFSHKEFNALGEDGRAEVYRRRKESKNNDNNNSGGNDNQGGDGSRAIQQMNVQQNNTNDDASALTQNSAVVSNADSQDRNRGGSNGDSIGRRPPP